MTRASTSRSTQLVATALTVLACSSESPQQPTVSMPTAGATDVEPPSQSVPDSSVTSPEVPPAASMLTSTAGMPTSTASMPSSSEGVPPSAPNTDAGMSNADGGSAGTGADPGPTATNGVGGCGGELLSCGADAGAADTTSGGVDGEGRDAGMLVVDGGTTDCDLLRIDGADHRLLISSDGKLASMQLSTEDFSALTLDPFNNLSVWSKVVAQVLPDDYDFYIFVLNQRGLPEGAPASGYMQHVHQHLQVEGIGPFAAGQSGFDNVPRLKGLVYLGQFDDLVNGPSLHEIAHTWGNFVIQTGDVHWNETDVDGQLGGGARGGIHEVSPGIYEVPLKVLGLGEPRKYADIELYLMGLVPSSEVGPIVQLLDPTTDDSLPASTYRASGTKTITIDDIIAEHGVRKPAVAEAQREFRAAFIAVTVDALSAPGWRFFRTKIDRFSATDDFDPTIVDVHTLNNRGTLFAPPTIFYNEVFRHNFHYATGGLATMTFDGLDRTIVETECASEPTFDTSANAACERVRRRAAVCAVPEVACGIDQDFEPSVGQCIADCADAADCTTLLESQTPVFNSYVSCTQSCQLP